MADRSKIEWTDATWNPVIGCKVVSPGCTNCYAMRLAGTRLRDTPGRTGLTVQTKAGPVWNGQVRFMEKWLAQPLHWAKPREIFVCAHSDIFYDGVTDEQRDQIFAVMALGRWHRFQVLTKRVDAMLAYLTDPLTPTRVYEAMFRIMAEPVGGRYVNNLRVTPNFPWAWPLPNVIVGVSVERQREANERRPSLRALSDAGWLTWVSYEPALGQVDWNRWEFLDWFVGGGESGSDARPSHPDWHEAARDYCLLRVIPFFFKQWGNWSPISEMNDEAINRCYYPAPPSSPDATRRRRVPLCVLHDTGEHFDEDSPYAFQQARAMTMFHVGKKAAGALLDGVAWRQTPVWPDVR